MDKIKIKKIFITLTIIFSSCILITAYHITHGSTEAKGIWDPKTKTYTDGTVKMTYVGACVQDIEYNVDDCDNKKSYLKTVNLDGKDEFGIRIYWKLENNSGHTISFSDLYKHAINGIPSANSVTQGGKEKTLTDILADTWPIDDGYYKKYKDLEPGESVKTFNTYSLNDTSTPIVIYFNDGLKEKSVGSYKIRWDGKQILGNQLTIDAVTNADKMAEPNKKEEAAEKEKLTKTLESITVDEKAKLTWTKADYDALVDDYGGKGTKLTDVLAKSPHPTAKDKSDSDITLDYDGPDSEHYVSLTFQQVSGSASDFTLVSKSEKGLK